ncbi:hypothetical protein H70357_24700 [Paenibacillus sp. FSL H7-0357]|uniref:hypothetical protein n=1 Tax=Paenibacillus sp. FSL H7-0357 TaxID=1536774 RepID=UPI0004F8DF5B|nr:hypothetical protein [Paenibacillus sp. FSL H7-0357]AIQ19554.1 hypothetical protein H70357_24700 [Paenibacillus sp. FSL H7-0357]
MNKLTQIKNDYEKCKATPGTYTTIPMDWYGYLLSLLEEKDKALAFYANEEVWLTTDIDGTYAVNPFEYTSLEGPWDVARKALNTSSNNEGDN